MKGQKCGWMSFAIFVYKSIYTTTTKSLQSCPTLCDPKDGSPPGSPVPGILQARTRVGFHFLQLMKVKSESEVFQSGPTLRDPVDCSPPGSSLHGSFQARVLKWGAIAVSIYIYICVCPRHTWIYNPSCIQFSFFLFSLKPTLIKLSPHHSTETVLVEVVRVLYAARFSGQFSVFIFLICK